MSLSAATPAQAAACRVTRIAVVVAKRTSPRGPRSRPDMVEVKLVPGHAVSEIAFSDAAQVVNQVTRFPISANQQILSSQVIPTTGGAGVSRALSYTIPQASVASRSRPARSPARAASSFQATTSTSWWSTTLRAVTRRSRPSSSRPSCRTSRSWPCSRPSSTPSAETPPARAQRPTRPEHRSPAKPGSNHGDSAPDARPGAADLPGRGQRPDPL